jgi:ATP-dependent Zn protease
MKRRSHQQGRKVGFDDLVHYALFGGGETDHPQNARPDFTKRVAIHEAGHALVAILDSDFKNIPDYVGIVASGNSGGKVSDCYRFSLDHYGQRTFRYIKHSIRVLIAGRIAESIVLGAEEVSFWGARSDLLNASRIAKDIIGKAGFGTDYGDEHPHDVNLLVSDDEFGVPEDIYASRNARTFLKNQYLEIENLLKQNRGLLEHLAHTLTTKKVLNETEVLDTIKQYTSTR